MAVFPVSKYEYPIDNNPLSPMLIPSLLILYYVLFIKGK